MPVIEVKLYDTRVTEESVPKMIEALTDALHESSGAAKERIHVIIQGVPPPPWGQGGTPGPYRRRPPLGGLRVVTRACPRAADTRAQCRSSGRRVPESNRDRLAPVEQVSAAHPAVGCHPPPPPRT